MDTQEPPKTEATPKPAQEEQQSEIDENSEITLTPEDLSKAVSSQVQEQLNTIRTELKEEFTKQVETLVNEKLKKRIQVSKPEAKKEDKVAKLVEDLQNYLTKFA